MSGRDAEEKVKRFLQSRGCYLQQERLWTPYGEVDLLFRNQQGLLLVIEVKSLSSNSDVSQRISPRQISRLKRVHQHFSEQESCRSLVFFVRFSGEMTWLGLEEFY